MHSILLKFKKNIIKHQLLHVSALTDPSSGSTQLYKRVATGLHNIEFGVL
jgi:hypothetical protein